VNVTLRGARHEHAFAVLPRPEAHLGHEALVLGHDVTATGLLSLGFHLERFLRQRRLPRGRLQHVHDVLVHMLTMDAL